MPKPSATPETTFVENQTQLVDLCNQCRSEGRFALDTEFVMEDRFEAEVCLIQIATRSVVAIVDPFMEIDLAPVWALVCDPAIETVVHAGQEDLALCVQHTGSLPRNIFDLQIAAGLVGTAYPISLLKLVQGSLRIRLHKSKTLTDWRKRPLSPEQIRYAAEDVCFLLEIRRKLGDRLARLGRTEWAIEEFARFEVQSLYVRAAEDRLFRLKGSGALKGVQLAILSELMNWRDALGKKLNRPARFIVKDHLLVEISRLALSTCEEVRDLRGLNVRDRDLQELCRIVQDAKKTPSSEWPLHQPREVESPWEASLAALLTSVLRDHTYRHDLSHNLVATQKTIRELIRHSVNGSPTDGAGVRLLKGWRGPCMGQLLDEILTGQRTVRVEAIDGKLRLHVSEP